MSLGPIWIRCEGSGQGVHHVLHCDEAARRNLGMCAMCGHPIPVDAQGNAQPHQRDDILARFNRGDFG